MKVVDKLSHMTQQACSDQLLQHDLCFAYTLGASNGMIGAAHNTGGFSTVSNLQHLVPPMLPEGVQRQLLIGSSWNGEKVIGLAQVHPAQSRSRTHLFLPSLPANVRFLKRQSEHRWYQG